MFFPLTVNDFLDRAVTVYPAQAASLDEMGVPVGGRVAIVSQNSARMLTSFFGVSGWGRVLVPVNFRLAVAEIRYIVEHSGAEVLMVDPDLRHLVDEVECKRTFVLGEDDDLLWGSKAELNATVFGWQASVSDRDVYLHTLPMFHANGWGHPFTATGMGATHIVLRQIDGAEILKRIEKYGVTYMCAAPAVVAAALDGAKSWEGEIPGRDRVRIIVAGAPPPTRTIERVREELGWEFIQIYGLTETAPLLTMRSTTKARCWRSPTTTSRRTGTILRQLLTRWPATGSTPATAGRSRTVTS